MVRLGTVLLFAAVSVALLDPIQAFRPQLIKNLPRVLGVVFLRKPPNAAMFGVSHSPAGASFQQQTPPPVTSTVSGKPDNFFGPEKASPKVLVDHRQFHIINTGAPEYKPSEIIAFQNNESCYALKTGEWELRPNHDVQILFQFEESFMEISQFPRERFPMGLAFDDTHGNTIELQNSIDVVSGTFTRAGLFERLPKDYGIYDIATRHLTLDDVEAMEQWHSAKMIAIHLPLGDTQMSFEALERLLNMDRPGLRVEVAKVKMDGVPIIMQ